MWNAGLPPYLPPTWSVIGDLERARQWADLAAAIAVEDSRASYNLACLYGMLGDVEEALVHVEKTLRNGRRDNPATQAVASGVYSGAHGRI